MLQQLDKSSELKDEVEAYRRMDEDHPEKTCDLLLGIIDRHLENDAEKRNRENLERTMSLKSRTALPAAGKEVCRKYLEGNCKKAGSCKYEHPPGKGGSQKKPKPDGGPDQSRGRGKGKDQDRGRSRGRSKSTGRGTVDMSDLPCFFIQ